MPTKETQRVAKHRREYFDRVSVLIDRGGKHLLKTLAVREGVSVAELVRRAVCARAGLRALPYPDELAKLEGINDPDEARLAIYRLQSQEAASEMVKHVLNGLSEIPDEAEFSLELTRADVEEWRQAVKQIQKVIDTERPDEMDGSSMVTVKLTGREVGVIRRTLANMMRII